MRILLISTYDLGRQPFGLASPAAWLREAGVEVACADLSREPLADEVVRAADLVGFFLPMHTATRLALPAIDRVRGLNPAARVCAYGLYAPLNAALLRDHGVDAVLAGEFEEGLRDFALTLAGAGNGRRDAAAYSADTSKPAIARLEFRVPDRTGLPPLSRYAMLQVGEARRVVGYTEASRGCKHRCRHCPIVPVYDGRFRVVPRDIVLADIRAQVAAGARHITFGDPDFFNGIGHAAALLEAFAREFPHVSYDVTIKVEHLLGHADRLPLLRRTGCAFVTTAVESLDDEVLRRLEKGHTRADFERVVGVCRDIGLTLSPTFVAFTPWTTLAGYCELLDGIARLELVEHVAPIQLSIRLLITTGSRLLELPDVASFVGPFDQRSLTYRWRHVDQRVDALHEEVSRLVGVQACAPRGEVFGRVRDLARAAAGLPPRPWPTDGAPPRATVPYLNEPWYC